MKRAKRLFLVAVFLFIFHSTAFAGNYININKIVQIESHGNTRAYNKYSQARGLCQITPICLKEWNNFHKKEQYNLGDLFNGDINKKIAIWYLEVRIPQMLKSAGKEVNTRNIIISYNAGIGYVVRNKQIPLETVNYIKKYNK